MPFVAVRCFRSISAGRRYPLSVGLSRGAAYYCVEPDSVSADGEHPPTLEAYDRPLSGGELYSASESNRSA